MICPDCGVDHHAPLTPQEQTGLPATPVTGYVAHEMISGRIAVLNGAYSVRFILAFDTLQEAEEWIRAQSAAASDD